MTRIFRPPLPPSEDGHDHHPLRDLTRLLRGFHLRIGRVHDEVRVHVADPQLVVEHDAIEVPELPQDRKLYRVRGQVREPSSKVGLVTEVGVAHALGDVGDVAAVDGLHGDMLAEPPEAILSNLRSHSFPKCETCGTAVDDPEAIAYCEWEVS